MTSFSVPCLADSGICNTNWSFLGLAKQWINKTKTTRRTDKDWIFRFGTEKQTGLDFVQSSRPSPPPFSVWSKRTLRDSRASAKVGWRRKNGKCLSFVLYLGFCTLVVPIKANVPYFSKLRYKYSSSFFLIKRCKYSNIVVWTWMDTIRDVAYFHVFLCHLMFYLFQT